MCARVCPFSVTHLMRGIGQGRREQKAFSFTPSLVCSQQLVGRCLGPLCFLAAQGRVSQTIPVFMEGKLESLSEQGANEEKGSPCPCALRPEAAPASTWGLPTNHGREAILGPGKTHGLRV